MCRFVDLHGSNIRQLNRFGFTQQFDRIKRIGMVLPNVEIKPIECSQTPNSTRYSLEFQMYQTSPKQAEVQTHLRNILLVSKKAGSNAIRKVFDAMGGDVFARKLFELLRDDYSDYDATRRTIDLVKKSMQTILADHAALVVKRFLIQKIACGMTANIKNQSSENHTTIEIDEDDADYVEFMTDSISEQLEEGLGDIAVPAQTQW